MCPSPRSDPSAPLQQVGPSHRKEGAATHTAHLRQHYSVMLVHDHSAWLGVQWQEHITDTLPRHATVNDPIQKLIRGHSGVAWSFYSQDMNDRRPAGRRGVPVVLFPNRRTQPLPKCSSPHQRWYRCPLPSTLQVSPFLPPAPPPKSSTQFSPHCSLPPPSTRRSAHCDTPHHRL